ncbi:hypothetical protein [Telmatospirillum sp. J64-1]|uniref:hypothetical protein n=1 Tax=Telmatospirillum sp. J64-1 TaxID=2502183 RepID=UPI00115D7363|nr:hypothetical protein [Telmatospirillum sp. J64-1]
MRWSPPAHSGYDVVMPITLYRVIGRRPSAVYVNEHHEPTEDCSTGNRLWDRVFLTALAEPGDQIQERSGGLVLVTQDGECHAVQLSEPEARSFETAFTQADHILAADRDMAERMLADGRLIPGKTKRLKCPPVQPASVKFDEDHPLVVDTLPEAVALAEAAPAPARKPYFR